MSAGYRDSDEHMPGTKYGPKRLDTSALEWGEPEKLDCCALPGEPDCGITATDIRVAAPGPWTTQDMQPYQRTINIRDRRNCFIAKVGGVDALPDRTLEANARLIAAAPDLLEAAEDALYVFSAFLLYQSEMKKLGRGFTGTGQHGEPWETIGDRLGAAITKATGDAS